jgi:hypothetical protein
VVGSGLRSSHECAPSRVLAESIGPRARRFGQFVTTPDECELMFMECRHAANSVQLDFRSTQFVTENSMQRLTTAGDRNGAIQAIALTSSTARPRKGTLRRRRCMLRTAFSVTRQLAYSMDESRRALDLGLLINGLPIATFELKNSLTKQTVADAVEQPAPTAAGGRKNEPELDRLSNILKTFSENFGTLFTDTDRVAKRIRDDIAPKVATDKAYQNAKENTPHTAHGPRPGAWQGDATPA